MYTEDKNIMPRETISDELLSRMLDSTRACCDLPFPARRNTCGCGNGGNDDWSEMGEHCNQSRRFGLEGYPLASVYAPLQEFRNLYDKESALKEGTLFAELNLPFMGRSVTKGGCLND